jgi:hypothetical protein
MLKNRIRLQSAKFAALENLEDSGDTNTAWDNIREHQKFGTRETR